MRTRLCALVFTVELACAPLCSSILNAQENRADTQVPQTSAGEPSDTLVAVGQWDHSSAVPDGGGASLDWLHSARPGRAMSLGLAAYAFGGSRWTLARAGASVRLGQRWTLEPQVSLGGGSAAGSSFLYQQYRARFLLRASSRFYVKTQEEYLNISDSHGHLGSLGAFVLPSRRFSMDVTYAHSLGGNLGTRFVSGRFDFDGRAVRPFAGFAAGQTAPALFDVGVGQQLVSQDLREGFVGFTFPMSAAEFTVAVDWVRVGGTQRSTLTAGVKIPIRTGSNLRSTP